MIYLMKPSNQSVRPETGATVKSAERGNALYISPIGTWSINNQSNSTIKFYNFIKYAHWKYSQYCCDVNVQKFIANIGDKIFEGYWNSSIFPQDVFPNYIGFCRDNIEDHGEYHEISRFNPLLDCAIITVDIIDNNHLRLHGPSGVIYLTRENEIN
jgi:hypothetical protein